MKVFLERLWQDLYHGGRMLAKNPASTLVAVISLAIGICANCAMYSWADALLLRPLPVARPGFNSITVGLTDKPDAVAQMKFGMLVSSNLFAAMGVEPELGRSFRADEDQVPGRDAVVVLDHALWEQQFSADPSILGRKIRLNGIEFTVIGVTPDRFTGMSQLIRPAFYVPLMMYPRLAADPLKALRHE